MNILKYFNRKAAELPISTLIILILVVVVLAAIGIMFFQNFTVGSDIISSGTGKAGDGIDKLVDTAP